MRKDCTTNFNGSLWRGDFNLQDHDRFNYEKNCSVSIKIFEFADFAGRKVHYISSLRWYKNIFGKTKFSVVKYFKMNSNGLFCHFYYKEIIII